MTHCLSNQVEKPRGREHHALGRAVFYAPSPACAHTVLRTILRTARIPSARHAVFHPAAPSFSIPPPPWLLHITPSPSPRLSPHPAIPRPHRQTPSPSLRLFPSHHPVPAPSISIPYAPSFSILPSRAPTVLRPPRFSARFRSAKKKIEKTSKKCKKGVDKSGKGWYYIKAVCERTAAAAAAATPSSQRADLEN